MAFQTPITIAEVVQGIHSKQYLLPAIQREFVWNAKQIEQLFDSNLRGYPIGSLLFWQVSADRQGDYQFYEFVRDYHEKSSRHNPKADLHGVQGLTAVLDGQQRLTSLYIGLRGSYAFRTRGGWWSNDGAFPVRRLYLDLLDPDDDWDGGFNFKFLTSEERSKQPDRWFRVGDVLDFDGHRDVNRYLNNNGLAGITFASDTLFDFYEAVHIKMDMNYYLEKGQDLDKVLNIFIRVNSGGTQLSYSDLLLSVATAQWKRLDAREEITRLVDELNEIGQGFRFDRDFVLKACLVLTDLQSVVFKVTNFTHENMAKIEDAWPRIEENLKNAVSLIASFGFSGATLTSANSVIPVAYYLMRREHGQHYLKSAETGADRSVVKHWLMSALLKGTFGDQADTVLSTLRGAIADTAGGFPAEEINSRLIHISKSVRFEPEEIDALLDNKYGQRQAFPVLALLYPSVDYRNLFHQDHIHPKSRFTAKKLQALGLDEAEAAWMIARVNDIPNLQMLEGTPNLEKSDKLFDAWLASRYPSEGDRQQYNERQYIPRDVDLSIAGFRDFYLARRALMRDGLSRVLMVAGAPGEPGGSPEEAVAQTSVPAPVSEAGSDAALAPSPDTTPAPSTEGAPDLHDDLARRLRITLEDTAANEGLVTYSELARSLGLELDDGAQRRFLAVLLGELSRAEVQAGRPMLSSLVVQYEGGTPGSGFLELGRELGLVEPGEDADIFAFRQMRATWRHWKDEAKAAG